ncbi:T9SS type A sorting domain-containing protein [Flavivirga spongiicola]|uniref:T9SS type A sorting domain-containing protein n=1 Tax=Flavivirga spongiicola TaxID=421621 RepID=A0ABU7XSX6_9FLAO|nr:T9SS type A sorting domain-containing protein [Flavivirga sp. MEBiC05379]MDO5978875.1 T9SS type A sorting domain-containing protein [Flavivirga sp. MEBiC05379]
MKKNLFLIFLIPFFSISQTKIGNDIDGKAGGDESGYSISLSSDGSIIAIGSPKNNNSDGNYNSGLVQIYKNVSGTWTQIGRDIEGETNNDESGYSVSLSADGSVVAIGAPNHRGANGSDSGHVSIYKYTSPDLWVLMGNNIDGEMAYDQSGYSVSLSSDDGSIVAIGAPNHRGANGSNSGHVRVYKYESSSDAWTQIGNNIDGEAYGDKSGSCVSLSANGSIVAIGAPNHRGVNGPDSGHVIVYQSTPSGWKKMGNAIDGKAYGDKSGFSISLSADGSVVAIGAPNHRGINGSNSGHVRIYKYISNDWTQIGLDIGGEAHSDESGSSVSLSNDGSVVAIGAIYNNGDNGLTSRSGHVRIYRNISGNWKLQGNDIDGEAYNDKSGSSVSLSNDGSVVAIGAIGNRGDSSLSNSGHTRVYDLSTLLSSDTFVLSQFRLFPNPSKGQTTIKLNKGLTLEKISIYNNFDQFIQSTQKEVIDTSSLSTGVYYVQVVTNKGKATKKLVIK